MADAARAAREYFRCVVEHDAHGIHALFAPDALWVDWRGTVLHGNDAIREWYVHNPFAPGRALTPHPCEPIVDGNRCAVEIDSDSGTHRNRVIDVFTVNEEGRVTTLRIYQGTYLEPVTPA